MGKKDIISKSIFQHLVRDFATHLFGLALDTVELLDTAKQRVEDRHADLVARVKDRQGEVFLLHIEIQNHHDPLMPQRMLRYLADLLMAHHPNLVVRQYLVYIGKEPLRMAGGLDLPQMPYRYEVVDMHRVDCHALLAEDAPEAWVLAVLCDFKDCPPRQVVHEILQRLLSRLHDEPPRLREYVNMLEILATNRNLNLNISEEFDMLTIDFEKLPTYQMGMKRGIEQGIEKGIEKGIHDQSLVIAEKLLATGMSPENVAAFTDLPLPEIENLQARKTI